MISHLRRYIALSLVLLLVLTGQSMAVARGSTDVAGQMVLCTGTGPVMVYVDENGAPVAPPQYCPDTALSLLAAVALPDFSLTPIHVARQLNPARIVVRVMGLNLPPHMARGPPFAV